MIVLDRIRLTGPVLTICPSLSREDEGHSTFGLGFSPRRHRGTEEFCSFFFRSERFGGVSELKEKEPRFIRFSPWLLDSVVECRQSGESVPSCCDDACAGPKRRPRRALLHSSHLARRGKGFRRNGSRHWRRQIV